jgi:plasmid stabilization system protein ParE
VAITIFQSIASLAQFPGRGRLGRNPNTRELIFPDLPLIAIYRIRDQVIEVIRIPGSDSV